MLSIVQPFKDILCYSRPWRRGENSRKLTFITDHSTIEVRRNIYLGYCFWLQRHLPGRYGSDTNTHSSRLCCCASFCGKRKPNPRFLLIPRYLVSACSAGRSRLNVRKAITLTGHRKAITTRPPHLHSTGDPPYYFPRKSNPRK